MTMEYRKAMMGRKTLSHIIWTDETVLMVYDYLRKGVGNPHIASRMGVTREALDLDLSKTTKTTLLKGLKMREKMMAGRKEKPTPIPYAARIRDEAKCQEMFGVSLGEKSDSNIYWMRDNGYTGNLRTADEKWKAKTKLKRLRSMREDRQELREQMEQSIAQDYGVLKPEEESYISTHDNIMEIE